MNEKDWELIREVSAFFSQTKDEKTKPEGSIRETALHFSMTRSKVQKILVTTKDYSTAQTREIQSLRESGLSVKEIAKRLNLSTATVSSSLPYSSRFYGTVQPSEHTRAVREYRANEKARAERVKEKKKESWEEKESVEQVKRFDSERKKETVKKEAVKKETMGKETTGKETTGKETKKMSGHLSRKTGLYLLPYDLMRLHVEMLGFSENESKILHEIGSLKRDNTITRDILVPSKMPLSSLHFTLQRALGFQETHLHCFSLEEEYLKKITGNSMETLLNLLGIVFTYRWGYGLPYHWPDYKKGSYKKWLRKQYTAPWEYIGDEIWEFYPSLEPSQRTSYLDLVSKDEVFFKLYRLQGEDYREAWVRENYGFHDIRSARSMDVQEVESKYVKWESDENGRNWKVVPCSQEDPDAYFIEKVRLRDMNVAEGLFALFSEERDPCYLIDRLPLDMVLAPSSDYLPFDEKGNPVHMVTGRRALPKITEKQIQKAIREYQTIYPKAFTDHIIYNYDYGDNWQFRITASRGCSDLVERGVVTRSAFTRAVQKASREGHPVLLAKDGDMLVEDVGGKEGFVSFLSFLNLGPDEVVKLRRDFPEDYEEILASRIEEMEEEDEEYNENGLTREELFRWALSQGWHKNDGKDINLL